MQWQPVTENGFSESKHRNQLDVVINAQFLFSEAFSNNAKVSLFLRLAFMRALTTDVPLRFKHRAVLFNKHRSHALPTSAKSLAHKNPALVVFF